MIGKVFIKTHGCQMNEYDSAKMLDLLVEGCDLTPTDEESEADVLLLNTCSIREKAQEKVFSQLGRWKKLKQQKPGTVIGVGGCVASQEGEALRQRAPFVDMVFGPQTLHRLPEMLRQSSWMNSTRPVSRCRRACSRALSCDFESVLPFGRRRCRKMRSTQVPMT